MTEVDLFSKLKALMKETCPGEFDLQRIEDTYSNGIPDVSYGLKGVNGYIELKHDAVFPVKFKNKLRKEQKPWLIKRGLVSGRCFVLHQLGNIFICYDYSKIYEVQDSLQEDTFKIVNLVMFDKLDERLIELLITQVKTTKINGLTHI